MAAESGIISSAVIVPDADAPLPSKRRQSSVSDSVSKRPRYSHDRCAYSPNTIHDSPEPLDDSRYRPGERRRDSVQDRRKSSIQEEKKRGQRLFGGLLSALSQSTPNGQQKRRQEVEKRQHEKAKQQKADDEKFRRETLANLKTIREAEQIKFNEAAMRTRHQNMLAKAHFLSTKTGPKMYYKPWKCTPKQKDHIEEQIATVEATVEREVEAFYIRYPSAREPTLAPAVDNEYERETNKAYEETVGEPPVELDSRSLSVSASNIVNTIDTTNLPAQAQQSVGADDGKEDPLEENEHNNEVVLENEEDTVIY